MIKNFSRVHNLQVLVTGLYVGALPKISQVMENGILESFKLHT